MRYAAVTLCISLALWFTVVHLAGAAVTMTGRVPVAPWDRSTIPRRPLRLPGHDRATQFDRLPP